MIDPYDTHRIVRALSTVATSTATSASLAQKLRPRYGMFALEVLPTACRVAGGGALGSVEVSPSWLAPVAVASGVAPVFFLRTAAAPETGPARCTFSRLAPTPSTSGTNAKDTATTTTLTTSLLPLLECSLGPAAMPYACALYPLGDFLTVVFFANQLQGRTTCCLIWHYSLLLDFVCRVFFLGRANLRRHPRFTT